MKYIRDFDYIVENKRNAKRFKNKGGLMRNDQFSGNVSLSKTLSDELGFNLKKEYTEGVGFDSTSLYDVKSSKTIMDDALTGKYTYDEILAKAKDWYKKNESVNEASGTIAKGAYSFADYFGIPVSRLKGFKFDGTDDVEELHKVLGRASSNIKGTENIYKASAVYENAKSDAKEIFDELMDVNGEEIADMDSQEAMTILSMRGIRGGKANMIAKELLKMTSSIGESLTEAKKFKPGDMWSSDFDYEGMLRYGLKVNEKTPIKMLNKLFDSATDVNYHTPFRNLGIAIDWIEDGDKKGAKDYIKNFHDDIKKEMKDQGIK